MKKVMIEGYGWVYATIVIDWYTKKRLLGIKQAFSSYNNPKGNADTERFMRRMKEELVWLR